MSLNTYSQLTSLLALLANGLTVAVLVVFIGGRFGRLTGARDWVRVAFRDVGVWIAAAVATTSTVGSLIYSEYFDLIPCRLCWYQRIAMYPLAVILLSAALRRDNGGARRYGVSLAVIGTTIAAYHYLIQQFPSLESGSCSLEAPCSAPYVWIYDFISIPYMALAGFALILALLLTTEKTPSND
ncbi:MAG: disulfide bond formation protein B [Acidimicrobiia bacterium]|nr:disulfide bond formation protein B [Acidimicrobiia bacterium]